MRELSDNEFGKVERFLQSLPKRANPSERSQCWRTADELVPLLQDQGIQWTGKQLDAALRIRYLTRNDCQVRPAYYPGEDNCKRLWGHQDKVQQGPGRDALRDKLMAKRHRLEPDRLSEEAPIVFLSHALEDHHFGARVRLEFARHNFRSWLAEGELHEGCNLFEAIEGALQRCDALMVLISSYSVSSAWMYTEALTALGAGKQIVTLVDASDAAICHLVSGWLAQRGTRLAVRKSPDWFDTDEGIQRCAAVLEKYRRVASPTRLLKFRTGVENALNSLTMAGPVALYPDLPPEWDGPAECVSFADMITRLKRPERSSA